MHAVPQPVHPNELHCGRGMHRACNIMSGQWPQCNHFDDCLNAVANFMKVHMNSNSTELNFASFHPKFIIPSDCPRMAPTCWYQTSCMRKTCGSPRTRRSTRQCEELRKVQRQIEKEISVSSSKRLDSGTKRPICYWTILSRTSSNPCRNMDTIGCIVSSSQVFIDSVRQFFQYFCLRFNWIGRPSAAPPPFN